LEPGKAGDGEDHCRCLGAWRMESDAAVWGCPEGSKSLLVGFFLFFLNKEPFGVLIYRN